MNMELNLAHQATQNNLDQEFLAGDVVTFMRHIKRYLKLLIESNANRDGK